MRAWIVMACLLVASCSEDTWTNVVFEEYLVDVTCSGSCVGPDGEAAAGRWVETRAIASTGASIFAPRGTYMYMDYRRDTTYVEIELDFPADMAGEVPLVASMREFDDGEATFESTSARGVIQISPPPRGEVPESGGFNIKFTAPGPDSVEGTDDDEVREIRSGRFEAASSPPPGVVYEPPYADTSWDDPDFGLIIEIWVTSETDDTTYYEDDTAGGCEGDTYDDSYDDDYSGCSSDTYDDPYYDDSGCGSDTTFGDSSGCEGDTYDGGTDGGCSCEGDDTYASSGPDRRALALLLPVLALFSVRSLRRRAD